MPDENRSFNRPDGSHDRQLATNRGTNKRSVRLSREWFQIVSNFSKCISVMILLELKNAFQKVSVPEPQSMYRRAAARQPHAPFQQQNRKIARCVHDMTTSHPVSSTCHCSVVWSSRSSRQRRACCETSLIWSPEKHGHNVSSTVMQPLKVTVRGLILLFSGYSQQVQNIQVKVGTIL